MMKFLDKFYIPWKRVEWVTCFFLGGTLLLTLTAVPWYILTYGLDWFQVGLFFFWFFLTGMSITFGYHRLFSHRSFEAKAPLRLTSLLFGAAAFENSALDWCSDHRRHHKHVDHEDDPYDISKGFFYAHLGWMLFKLKPLPPMENVADLRKDPLVMWQHRYWHLIGFSTGFVLPTIIGYIYGGPIAALGALLISGVARTVAVQHCTFCINSACHTLGTQPYSARCSARDSWVMAIFTFGEGYHNFHHEFQHDYRNGVKPWQFDPTKWSIWLLSKVGLTSNLRQVGDEKIRKAQEAELDRQRLAREGKEIPALAEQELHPVPVEEPAS